MRRGAPGTDGAAEEAGEVALVPTFGDKFFHGAREPGGSVTNVESPLEEGLKDRGSAVRMLPNEVLGVKARPVGFEDSIVGFEVAPHLGLWVGRNDGDLRDVEFERGKREKIRGNGFRGFRRKADNVVAVGV